MIYETYVVDCYFVGFRFFVYVGVCVHTHTISFRMAILYENQFFIALQSCNPHISNFSFHTHTHSLTVKNLSMAFWVLDPRGATATANRREQRLPLDWKPCERNVPSAHRLCLFSRALSKICQKRPLTTLRRRVLDQPRATTSEGIAGKRAKRASDKKVSSDDHL